MGCDYGLRLSPAGVIETMRHLAWLISILLVLGLMLLTPALVLALDPPTSATFAISDISLWRHYQETGDLLVVARYNTTYASPPSENIGQTFLLRLNNSSTELSSNNLYSYSAGNIVRGYGEGLAVIYLSASQATTAGFPGLWGNSNINVQLAGNPSLTWSTYPTRTSYSLTWTTYTSHADTAAALATTLLSYAQALGNLWTTGTTTVNLIADTSSGHVLSTSGEGYFTNVFPFLRTAIPALFGNTLTKPSIDTETHAKTAEANLRNQVTSHRNALDRLGNEWFGGNQMMPGIIIALIAMGVMIGLAVRFRLPSEAGLIGAVIIMLGMTRLGIMSMTAMGVGAIFSILLLTFVFFFKKA